MRDDQLHELLFQALETELGGARVYEEALRGVKNDDLREEWDRYHDQTVHHIEIVEGVLAAFGLDPATETPGRLVVRHIGASLVKAMEMAGATALPRPPSWWRRVRHPGRNQGPPQLGAHRRDSASG